MTDPVSIQLGTGEIVALPAELWPAIEEATAVAALHLDPHDARTAFGVSLAGALHRRGLILVARARSKTSQAVEADLYSLALSAKYDAERRLAAALAGQPAWDGLCTLLLGQKGMAQLTPPLLDDLGTGILALAGRAPPEDRRLVYECLLRIRGAAAICAGVANLGEVPPLDDKLVEFLMPAAKAAEPDPGAGEAIR